MISAPPFGTTTVRPVICATPFTTAVDTPATRTAVTVFGAETVSFNSVITDGVPSVEVKLYLALVASVLPLLPTGTGCPAVEGATSRVGGFRDPPLEIKLGEVGLPLHPAIIASARTKQVNTFIF